MAIITKKTVSTNALTGEQIKMVNLLYPVGTFYETADADFNPNTVWVGTWTLVSSGRWRRTA